MQPDLTRAKTGRLWVSNLSLQALGAQATSRTWANTERLFAFWVCRSGGVQRLGLGSLSGVRAAPTYGRLVQSGEGQASDLGRHT